MARRHGRHPANARSSRSAARLAAVQALYQQEMEATPVATLLHEFHHHRLGATIDGVEYADAEVDFFDDMVKGVDARRERARRADRRPSSPRAGRWRGSTSRCGRSCAPAPTSWSPAPTCRPRRVISEYVDVAKAFYDAARGRLRQRPARRGGEGGAD